MSSGWDDVRLGDLVSIQHGWPFKSKYCTEQLTGRPIVVSIGNFQYSGGFRFDSTTCREYTSAYPAEYELAPNDILLVMTCQTPDGEILGIPGRIPNDGNTYLHNQRMGKVVVNRTDLVHADFLYWVFLWSEFNRELVASASGTKIVHTAPSRIEAFRFALPPLPEQRAIAHILGALDDKIELNRRMNKTLEEMAAAIFKSWFVDFDPVVAKSQGKQPFGMTPEVAGLFPDSFEETEGGVVPKGWRMSTIGEIGTNIKHSRKPTDVDPATPYIGLEHMPRKSIALADWGCAGDVCSGKFGFRTGEILFGKLRPYFHKVGVAPIGGVCSTDILVLGARSDHFFGLLLGYVSSTDFINHVDAASGGTRMPRTDWATMERYSIVVPPDNICCHYTQTMRACVKRIHACITESHTLAELRDTLLPKLLSGEIRVKEAEKMVEAAV